MKRLVLATAMMMGVALAAAPKAEAALAFSFHICQGVSCTDFAGTSIPTNTVVGDYTLFSANGSGLEGTPTSLSSTTTTQIRRTGSSSAAPLDVWFTVTGYTIPNGPGYLFDVSLGTTQTNFGGAPGRDLVSYQAWYSSNNSTGFPTGSPSALASCTPPQAGLSDSCNSNPSGVNVAPGSNLFAIISQTRFNIAATNTSTFQSNGQAAITAVPEPGSMILLGTGLVGMATLLRRRSAKN